MHHSLGRSGGGVPPNLRAVLVDTKGPEIRTGKLQGGVDVAEIVDGSEVILTLDDVSEDNVEETGFRLHVDYVCDRDHPHLSLRSPRLVDSFCPHPSPHSHSHSHSHPSISVYSHRLPRRCKSGGWCCSTTG